jgi:hypothetical protein
MTSLTRETSGRFQAAKRWVIGNSIDEMIQNRLVIKLKLELGNDTMQQHINPNTV